MNPQGLLGVAALLALAWALSEDRRNPPWRLVGAGLVLQVVLALERSVNSGPSFLPQLQDEILQVIKKYIDIDNENVSIELDRGPEMTMLDINIELPASPPTPSRRLPVLQSAH